jgi:hypothetical protein
METQNLEIKIKQAKPDETKETRTVAFVNVKCGPLWANFRLDKSSKGKFFLNPPSTFVEHLKGKPRANGGVHTGFMAFAGLNTKSILEVKEWVLKELGLAEAA